MTGAFAPVLIFSKFDGPGGAPAAFIVHGRIVAAGRVDILVSQDIGNQVDVTGLTVERGAVGASQLMRRNVLDGHSGGIFLDQVLDGLDGQPALLGGIEEGVLVSGDRGDSLPDLQIVFERAFNLLAEVDHCLVTALADDPDPVVSEVQVLHVEPDTLGDTDPGT